MVKLWLKRVNPHPAWTDLCEVVKDFNPRLADEIKKKYVRSSF